MKDRLRLIGALTLAGAAAACGSTGASPSINEKPEPTSGHYLMSDRVVVLGIEQGFKCYTDLSVGHLPFGDGETEITLYRATCYDDNPEHYKPLESMKVVPGKSKELIVFSAPAEQVTIVSQP